MPDSIERIKVAFSLHYAMKISQADAVMDYSELAFLSEAFPAEQLRSLGLLDAGGNLKGVVEAFGEARTTLACALSDGEKLSLITLFFKACLADHELHPDEYALVREAAAELGISATDLSAHLSRISEAPPVRR